MPADPYLALAEEVRTSLAWMGEFVGEVRDNNGTPMPVEWADLLAGLRDALQGAEDHQAWVHGAASTSSPLSR